MATYAEFLKSQGATDEEIKVLDTPSARKGYDTLQKQAADAAAAAAQAKAKVDEYDKWYNDTIIPNTDKLLKERDTAQAEAAAERARLKKLQELGLLAVAEGEGGGQPQPQPQPQKVDLPDLSKYVTSDTLLQVAEREGDAIAIAQDIAYEHRLLFPDRPLNFRELRKEAVSTKKSVEQLWMEKYGVQAAREKKATEEKAAYEKKLRDEGAAEERSRHLNPETRVPVPSANPFSKAPASATSNAQPWQKTDGEREHSRIDKVLKGHPELLQ